MNRPVVPAASVLLLRGTGPVEVFVVRRADALRFFGGFYAFPGGKVCPADAEVPVVPPGEEPPLSGPGDAFSIAAVRELFEETGVLLARREDGSFLPGPDLEFQRRAMVEEKKPFGDVLRELRVAVRREELTPLGRVVTPPFTTTRFDTAFFRAELPPGQEPFVWPGELAEGAWTTPEALLRRWERGACLVSPPTVAMLDALRGAAASEVDGRLDALFREVGDRDTHRIYFAPDVQFIPLRTDVLPPSSHTNAYLVGRGPAYLIDPGPTDPAEQRHLCAVLDAWRSGGRTLSAIVLTHHHIDHAGAAAAVAERFGVPVWAHAQTARALAGKVAVTKHLEDGARLPLGTSPDGRPDWHLLALHTPGHAPGHLAFYDPHYRLLFTGDLISTQSSVVIAPPEGDLAAYLASLSRLRGYGGRLLLPAHGGPTARLVQTIDEAIEHRRSREEMLRAALGRGACSVPELAVELYKGVPENLMTFARLQTWAGLRKLQTEGRVRLIGQEPDGPWALQG
jgi:glyoxylase-like metal-dependent hydrolase (beta-lactamase superfamily II)/8-oxo-dGTP pyrophosphatase MutT (NUDIX family)